MLNDIFNDIKKIDKMDDFERKLLSENLLKEALEEKEKFTEIVRNIKFKNDPEFYDYNLWDIYSILAQDLKNWREFIIEEIKRLLNEYKDESSLKDINYFLFAFKKMPDDKELINEFINDLFKLSLDKNPYLAILIYDFIIDISKNSENEILNKVMESLIKFHDSKDWKIRVYANKILKKHNIKGFDKELSFFDKIKAGSLKFI
jgi:hypothetical protein